MSRCCPRYRSYFVAFPRGVTGIVFAALTGIIIGLSRLVRHEGEVAKPGSEAKIGPATTQRMESSRDPESRQWF